MSDPEQVKKELAEAEKDTKFLQLRYENVADAKRQYSVFRYLFQKYRVQITAHSRLIPLHFVRGTAKSAVREC